MAVTLAAQRGLQTAALLVASGDVTGTTDLAAINAALTAARTAGGGVVKGRPGETFYINGTIVQGSDTTLDMTGCKILMVSGSNKNMWANYAHANGPVLTLTGSISSGSKTLTVVGAGNAALFTPGQTIQLSGAAASSAVPHTAILLSKNTGANTLGLDTAAGASANTQTLKAWNRDRNIKVIGGTWDFQANTGAALLAHAFIIRHVDGLVLSPANVASTGGAGGGGMYAISAGAFTSADFGHITFGYQAPQEYWTGQPGYKSDGIHIIGPASDLAIHDIYGCTGDDMVILMPQDWTGPGEIGGDITNAEIRNIHSQNTFACAIKLNGGKSGALKKVRIRGVYGTSQSSFGAIWIGDDNRSANTNGGLIDDISIEDITVAPTNNATPQVLVNGKNIKTVKLSRLFYDNASGSSAGIIAVSNNLSDGASIGRLHVEHMVARNRGGSQAAVTTAASTTVSELVYRNSEPLDLTGLIAASGTVTTTVTDP